MATSAGTVAGGRTWALPRPPLALVAGAVPVAVPAFGGVTPGPAPATVEAFMRKAPPASPMIITNVPAKKFSFIEMFLSIHTTCLSGHNADRYLVAASELRRQYLAGRKPNKH